MKNQKTKNLTLMLASALGAAALTGAVYSALPASADEASATTYSVSTIFGTSNASSVGTTNVAFALKDNARVTLKQRDLALKWYEGKDDVKYFSTEFSFSDTDFETVTLVIETASAVANKEGKTVNKLVFSTNDGKVYAAVNPEDDATVTDGVEVAATQNIVVRLGEESVGYDEYSVSVNDVRVGTFENVGATFGEYASSSATTPLMPFAIEATFAEEAKDDAAVTNLNLYSINGQSFALNENGEIEDTAVPVLVVNDKLTSFTIGTAFALDYEVVDVLDRTVTKSLKYYAYDPTVEAGEEEYEALTTSTYFTETNYTEGDVETSVFAKYGYELVSIRFTLSDENHKEDGNGEAVGKGATTYYLAWYTESQKAPNAAATDETYYILVDDNKDGAYYTFLSTENGENEVTGQSLIDDYQALVTEKAKDLKAGSSASFTLPSLRGLIADNGGYENLKFTIVYKSSNATSESTKSSLSSSSLKFNVTKSGLYEFKVFANDKAGNTMQYYLDGELVSVTSSNVWKIDEIPYFSFNVAKTPLSIDEEDDESDRRQSVTIGSTYDDFELDLSGDSSATATVTYKLYRIDFDAYNLAASTLASSADLSKISYAAIAEEAKGKLSQANGDYDEFFKNIYAELLASRIGGDATAEMLLEKNVFVEIDPYNDAINEEDHPDEWAAHNQYEWNETEARFTATHEGTFLILAVYSDPLIGSAKACGYKVVSVASEDDVIPGETEWLKNNIVSVVLFGIAALMLVAIIVIAFIKPTDETLEDVDVAAKKAPKAKKDKK
ncbi:MAG: hypothetical protein IJX81_06835 [Clostridia bacterium]|nr:hypothetical protein [Clostridia bacterium]